MSAATERQQRVAVGMRIEKLAEINMGENDRTARFVASSNAIDRYGDIIEQDWDLANFWRNPVFLWSHDSWSPPIGWVREFAPTDDRTRTIASVEFLPPGVDDFTDKVCRMVQLKALRAVSVGFRALEVEERLDERGRWDGFHFLRNELIELSLCTVPANQDAIALAKSVDSHPRFLRRLFVDGVFRADTAPIARQAVSGTPLRDDAHAALMRIKRIT